MYSYLFLRDMGNLLYMLCCHWFLMVYLGDCFSPPSSLEVTICCQAGRDGSIMITEHFEVLIKQTYHTCKMYWKTNAWQYNILLTWLCVHKGFMIRKNKKSGRLLSRPLHEWISFLDVTTSMLHSSDCTP